MRVSSVLVTDCITVLRSRCAGRGANLGRLAAPEAPEESTVLAVLNALEEEVGLVLRQAAITDFSAEPRPRVSEPNLSDCVADLT